MTREEAKELFEDNFTVINTHGHYTKEEEGQAQELAISALSAIEKIRAEIQENLDTYKGYRWEEEVKAYSEVLEIIDKHIGGKDK